MLSSFPLVTVIPVRNIKASKNFYADKLDLDLIEGKESAIGFKCGDCTKLYIYNQKVEKEEHSVAIFVVKDIENVVNRLKKRGVQFKEYNDSNLVTKNSIAQLKGEKAAWIIDPDGNILGLSEAE